MTDAEFEEQRTRIGELVKKWMPILLRFGWSVDVRYETDPDRSWDIIDQNGNCHGAVMARTSTQWQYLRAYITFNPKGVIREKIDNHDLEELVLHEMMHVVLDEMSAPEKDEHEERVATTLAKILMKATDVSS